ncbi:MAG: NrdH-redoxin [Actinomycetota bacterium]|nr:NrdH-redoxin [Actinomycetota bacterium]
MDETVSPTPRIEVLWRPGYPYCAWLRRGLERAGIDTVERDIWSDPGAAARVRAATGGDETVPTVIVGSRALVNPSVAQVVSAVRAEFPDDAEALVGAAPTTATRPLAGGAGWTAAIASA